jgi:hypothetical protein
MTTDEIIARLRAIQNELYAISAETRGTYADDAIESLINDLIDKDGARI